MNRLPRHDHYIAGEWTAPADGECFASVNPATAEPWYEAANGTAADVERAVGAARAAFEDPRWRDLSQTRRGRLLRDLGDLIGETRRGAGPHRIPGQRQAAARDARPTRGPARVLLLLRRAGRQDPRRDHPGRQPANAELHPARTARRGRRHHSVELTAAADRHQAGPGAGRRQHHGDQALRAHLGLAAGAGARCCEEAGFPPGVVNVVTGFGATEAGNRWSSTRAWPR